MTASKAVFFCDGSAKPTNPGFGGYGIFGYTYKETERSKNIKHPAHGTLFFTPGGVLKEKGTATIEVLRVVEVIHAVNNPLTSNNLAELLALQTALLKSNQMEDVTDVTVFTDSSYVVDAFNKNIDIWKRTNWKTQTGKDVSNVLEMMELDRIKAVLNERGIKMNVNWVKGHDESHGNQMADIFSVIGSNSARRQFEAGTPFQKVVFESDLAYGDYKKTYLDRDVLYFMRDLYFTSAAVDDTGYCFLSTSDNPNNKGKRDTSSLFMTNVGQVPAFINQIKAIFRKVPRKYITTCTAKISILDNKELYRLIHLVNVEDMLVKKVKNDVVEYQFVRDDKPFLYEANVDYPFIMDASRVFARTVDIANSNKTDNPDLIVRDITDRIVKEKKIVLSNKDKSVDFTDVISDSVQLKQKLLMTVGYDIPSYLALKNIEEDIQQVYLILESKPNSNHCTLYIQIVTADRNMYSVNIENKYLRTTTHQV